jgi:ferredoxin
VCCTCRAKIMQGSVVMDKNFTLEAWESAQGFVLSCQARPTSDMVVISYDERYGICTASATVNFYSLLASLDHA